MQSHPPESGATLITPSAIAATSVFHNGCALIKDKCCPSQTLVCLRIPYLSLRKENFMKYINRKYDPRQADIQPLKDEIKALLKAYRIQGKMNEVFIVASWEKIMGKAIALKTKELYFKDNKLFVQLTSAPLKHELIMSKTKVIELINTEVGETVIEEVVFL